MAIVEEAVATLGKWGMTEIYNKILSFRCTRERTGRRHAVTVDIFEGQGGDPQKRFCAVATSDQGKNAAGVPTHTVEGAIDSIHWTHLDL